MNTQALLSLVLAPGLLACEPDPAGPGKATDTGSPGAPDTAEADSAEPDTDTAPETGEDEALYETWSGEHSLSEADAVWTGERDLDVAGYAVRFAGDVDGDGRDDLLVGSPGVDTTVELAGAAYLILHASRDGGGSLAEADAKLVGEGQYHAAGLAVSPAGDVDGDGYDDLAIGAPSIWSPYYDVTDLEGRVYLVSGLGAAGTLSLATAEITWHGEEVDSCFGATLASGDVDGDGLSDLAIGAPVSQANGYDAGGAWLMLGAHMDLGAEEADFVIPGPEGEACAGGALSLDGDIDGDGLKDLLVGGHWSGHWCDGGGAYLALAASLSGMADLGDADARWTAPRNDYSVGQALVSPGDLDGDGLDDVAIAAPSQELSGKRYVGAVYLVPGAVAVGEEELYDVATAIWVGEQTEGYFGYSLDKAGDLDHDGRADLLIGAIGAEADAGAVYLALGADASGTTRASGMDASFAGEPGDYAGYAVSGGGDANGDGEPDLLVGSLGATSAGITRLLLSPP